MNELSTLLKTYSPNPSTTIDVDFVDAKKLYGLISKIVNNQFTLVLSENPITNAASKVFIALVNLSEYFKFITDENNNLVRHIFEANIRDYQGIVPTNEDSRDKIIFATNNQTPIQKIR